MVYVSTEPRDISADRYNLVTSMKLFWDTSIPEEDEVDVMDEV